MHMPRPCTCTCTFRALSEIVRWVAASNDTVHETDDLCVPMPGRLVHDGTMRRVGESPLGGDGAAAAAAASFFRFVASQMRGTVDTDALLNEYMNITGAGPPDDKPSGKGLSTAEYAALQKTKYATIGRPTDCPVCLTSFRLGDPCKLLPCQHMFCEKCTKRWMDSNTTCPMCRCDCRFADMLALNEQRRRARAMPTSLVPLVARPPPTLPPAESPVPPSPRARQVSSPRSRQAATHTRSARLSAGGGNAAHPLCQRPSAGVTATAYAAPTRRPTPSPRGTVHLASPHAASPRTAPHRPASGAALEAGGALGSPRSPRHPHPHRPPRAHGHAAPSPRSGTAGASPQHYRPRQRRDPTERLLQLQRTM